MFLSVYLVLDTFLRCFLCILEDDLLLFAICYIFLNIWDT